MNADEMMARYLKTGELPEMPIMSKGLVTLLKNENFSIHYRDLLDEVLKKKNNPWREIDSAQTMLTTPKMPTLLKELDNIILKDTNGIIFKDIHSHPEEIITLFKSKDAQKAVFDDHVKEGIFFMEQVVLIFLNIIFSPTHKSNYFDSETEIGKRLLTYLRTQTEFLENLLKRINEIPQQPKPINKGQVIEKSKELSQIFEYNSDYKNIMEILVEKKFVRPITYIWKDDKKGNKGLLAALIKDLHSKKYYKDNIRPTTQQIQAICKKTFGWDIGIDTIKKAQPDKFDFSFIPVAPTVKK